jgi:hypothetical protein
MPLSLPILPVALQKIVDFLRHCSKVETAYSVRESLVGGYPAVLFPYYILVDAHGTVAAHGHLTEMAMKLDEMSREDMTGTSADDKSRESAKP